MNIDTRYLAITTAILFIITLATIQFWMPYIGQWSSWVVCIMESGNTCCGSLCCGGHP